MSKKIFQELTELRSVEDPVPVDISTLVSRVHSDFSVVHFTDYFLI